MSETVTVSRRDLLLLIDAAELGKGREQDAALRRLEMAAGYERSLDPAPVPGIARYRTAEDVIERDDLIMRLLAERRSKTEVAVMVGVTTRTIENAKRRSMARKTTAEMQDLFLGDLEAVLHNAWQVVHGRPQRISPAGKPVTDADGNPMLDVGAITDALDVARKTVGDMIKLTGAEAPRRSITAKVDLRKQAEEAWHDLVRPVTAEIVTDGPREAVPG
jgi:hypothetical protein